MTALGSSLVLITKKTNEKFFDFSLGLAAGIMMAASFWSLLTPAIELSKGQTIPAWIPPVVGFLAGALFLFGLDRILPHLHLRFPVNEAEGIKTSWRQSTLLVLALTLHNIPEGLALGIAFSASYASSSSSLLTEAITLAVGLGFQNIPEGLAVSMPLRHAGNSPFRSFWYGLLSGVVEPIASLLGALTTSLIIPIHPFALAFAAGAMIFVVVEEVIPESQRSGHADLATSGVLLGLLIMMILNLVFS